MHSIKYIVPKIIELKYIFFIFCGSFKYGGKKYSKVIPPNAPKLPKPVTKVSNNPSPKIGNILSKEKFLILATNRNIILITTNGIINKLTFAIEEKRCCKAMQITIINVSIIKIKLVIG